MKIDQPDILTAIRVAAKAIDCVATLTNEVCTGPMAPVGVKMPANKREHKLVASAMLSCWDEAFDVAKQLGVTQDQLVAAKALLGFHTVPQIRELLTKIGR
jgi:hypothetical protein